VDPGGTHGIRYKYFNNLYSSPRITKMIKSKRKKWAGYIARIEGRGTRVEYWWESQKEREY
jgi:hypothetical protein